MNNQELENECNMLQGNVNKIMVTTDLCEMKRMFSHAVDRIELIFRTRYKKVLNDEIQLNKKMIQNHLNSIYGLYADTDSLKVEKEDKNK